MSFKVRSFLSVVISGTVLAGCSIGLGNSIGNGSSDVTELHLGQSKAASHPVSKGIDKFAEIVEEKSEGKLIIETYHDASLGSDREVIESVQQGTLEMASSSTPNLSSFTDIFTAWDLPYIFESKEEVYEAIDGEPGERAREELEDSLFKVIFFPDYGFRQIVNNEQAVKVPEDLDGMKIRTTNSPIEQADFEAFGANPTPIAWAEVFTALQQGTVEGEGNTYSLLWDTKHQEVLEYAVEVNYNYSSDIVVMNKGKFDSLSEDHQHIIMEAGKEAVEWQRNLANEREEEAKQRFVESGVEIYEPTEEEMKNWKQSTEPVWDQFVKEGRADPDYVNLILDTLGKSREDIFQ